MVVPHRVDANSEAETVLEVGTKKATVQPTPCKDQETR
jgi:hypothetical protein